MAYDVMEGQVTEEPAKAPLPADLPTDWQADQIIAPTGEEVGLPEQYGYNYLMEQINATQRAVNEADSAAGDQRQDLSDHLADEENPHKVTAEQVGAVPSGGTSGAAEKLANARTIRTNLGSSAGASFDGSKDINPGVTGTLPVANGGTGATSASAALASLGITYGTSNLTAGSSDLETGKIYLVYK